jgi:hypothetical protein
MAAAGLDAIDTPNEKAETIWEACYNGDLIVVKQLLKLGRSVNAENAVCDACQQIHCSGPSHHINAVAGT